jgi:hypothetical protein
MDLATVLVLSFRGRGFTVPGQSLLLFVEQQRGLQHASCVTQTSANLKSSTFPLDLGRSVSHSREI